MTIKSFIKLIDINNIDKDSEILFPCDLDKFEKGELFTVHFINYVTPVTMSNGLSGIVCTPFAVTNLPPMFKES